MQKYGEHTITYRLRLSEDVIKTQTDYYITNNIDLKQLQWFFENELSQTDLLGCYSDCDACKKVGDLASFTVKTKAILQKIKDEKYPALKYPNFDINSAYINQWITNQYTAIVANCNIIAADCVPSPCEQKLEMMKYDVRPGGQYLLYDQTYNIPVPEAGVTIINYTNGVLLNYKSDPVITNFEFTDENGVVHHIKDADVTVPQFIKAYLEHPEWADDFVKRHIEYCSYLWCKDASNPTPAKNNEVSYKFDEKLKETVTKGSDAVSAGYYSQTDYLLLSDVDPFFNGGRGTSYKEQFQSDLESLSAVLRMRLKDLSNNDLPVKNIQEFVEWMLYCKPTNENATAADFANSWSCIPAANCRSLTGEWELYRNYYLKIKSKYVRLAKLANDPGCENCFIGQDPITSSTGCANPGPLSDYSFQTWIEPNLLNDGFTIHYDLVYKEGTAAFRGDYNIVVWGNTFTSKKGDLKVKDVFLYGCSGFPYPCDPAIPLLESIVCAPVDPQLSCGDNGGGGGGTFTCPVLSDFNITQGTDGFGNNTIVVDYIGSQAPFPAGVNVSLTFNAEFTYGPDIITFNVANSTGDWIYTFPSNLLFVEYNTAVVSCPGLSGSGSCPTASDFSYYEDNYGATLSQHCPEYEAYYNDRLYVYNSGPVTQPVNIKIYREVNQGATGTTIDSRWETLQPGQDRLFLGQIRSEWIDNNCNNAREVEEITTYNYYVLPNGIPADSPALQHLILLSHIIPTPETHVMHLMVKGIFLLPIQGLLHCHSRLIRESQCFVNSKGRIISLLL